MLREAETPTAALQKKSMMKALMAEDLESETRISWRVGLWRRTISKVERMKSAGEEERWSELGRETTGRWWNVMEGWVAETAVTKSVSAVGVERRRMVTEKEWWWLRTCFPSSTMEARWPLPGEG